LFYVRAERAPTSPPPSTQTLHTPPRYHPLFRTSASHNSAHRFRLNPHSCLLLSSYFQVPLDLTLKSPQRCCILVIGYCTSGSVAQPRVPSTTTQKIHFIGFLRKLLVINYNNKNQGLTRLGITDKTIYWLNISLSYDFSPD
jgi:hypothetical protein